LEGLVSGAQEAWLQYVGILLADKRPALSKSSNQLTLRTSSDGVEIDIHQLDPVAEFPRLRELLDQVGLEISVL
jgi:hypothetical protein